MKYRATIGRFLCVLLALVLCFCSTAAAFADATWYCPKCGRKCDSTYNFCPVDGTAKPSDLGNSTVQETAVSSLQLETLDDVESWTGIRALAAGEWSDYLFGVKEDGTLRVAIDADYQDESEYETLIRELSGWNHIKQLVTSLGLPVALKEDGTVLIPSELSSEESITVYSENLSGIKNLIPVKQDYDFYETTDILGIKQNGKACWIVSQQNDTLEKDGLTSERKLLNLLGNSEPVTVYYSEKYDDDTLETVFTALTTDNRILSTQFSELNGLKGVKAIYEVILYNGDPAVIASMSDGSTRIAGLVSNYKETNAAYALMKKEIATWRNVQDISTRFDDGQILGILDNGSVVQVTYDTACAQVSSEKYIWIPGLKVSDITDAVSFTSRDYGLIILKNGTIAPSFSADSTGYSYYYSVPVNFKISAIETVHGNYYALSEDGHVCAVTVSQR